MYPEWSDTVWQRAKNDCTCSTELDFEGEDKGQMNPGSSRLQLVILLLAFKVSPPQVGFRPVR
jgi:hypothetical protein